PALAQAGMRPAEGDRPAREAEQGPVGSRPADPAERIVLTIGVVVALLAVADFVAGAQHRRALGEKEGGQQVALPLRTAKADCYVRRFSLGAAVVAEVLV